jgi:hypothetical protein
LRGVVLRFWVDGYRRRQFGGWGIFGLGRWEATDE